MTMEEFNKKKEGLETQRAEAEAGLDGVEVGRIEQELAQLEANKHTYETVTSEVAQDATESQVKQITELGGSEEVLHEKVAEKQEEAKEVEQVLEEKSDSVVEDNQQQENDPAILNLERESTEEEKTENQEQKDPKIEALKKFIEDAENVTKEDLQLEQSGIMLDLDRAKEFGDRREITIDDFRELSADKKEKLFSFVMQQNHGFRFLRNQDFLKVLSSDQLNRFINAREDSLLNSDPKLLGSAINFNGEAIKRLETQAQNQPIQWKKTLNYFKLAEIAGNKKEGFNSQIFKETFIGKLDNPVEKLKEAKAGLMKEIEGGILQLRRDFSSERGLTHFLSSEAVQKNFFQERSFFDILKSSENNLVKKQLEQGNKNMAFDMIKTYSYMKEKGLFTEEQYNELVGKPE